MLRYQILVSTIHGRIFKISAPTWNKNSERYDGSYSVSDIQDYFEFILKNMEKRLMILQ